MIYLLKVLELTIVHTFNPIKIQKDKIEKQTKITKYSNFNHTVCGVHFTVSLNILFF